MSAAVHSLTLITAANGTAVLYEHDAEHRTLSSTRGTEAELEQLAREHHPHIEIRHVPPKPAPTK